MAAIICTHCNAMVPDGDDICPYCGHPVDYSAQYAVRQSVYQEPAPKPPVEEPKGRGGIFGWFRRRKKSAKSSGKHAEGSQRATPPAQLQVEPEGVTTMLSQTNIVDDEATGVLQVGSNVLLRRLATGEDYSLVLPVTIGRGSDADCHVLGNKAIGRKHVRIAQSNDASYLITDLHSTNGTFVRDAQLQPNRPTTLALGERFRLANEEFVLGEVRS